MHAIDTQGSIDGKFTEGNPGIGQRATRLGADWLNDLQANLLALCAEGKINAKKGRALDLVDAIKAIAIGVAGDAGQAAPVPATRKITTRGLLTSDGADLSQDRTYTVAAASAEDVRNGVADDKAVTPKALMDAMAANLAGRSATIGPLTFKKGENLGVYGQGAIYTAFPTPFPVECWGVIPIARNDSGGTSRDVWLQLIGAPSKDGFTVMVQDSSSAGNRNCDGIEYIAIGR